MDAERFDAFARSLAGRLSRRAAMQRAGATGIAGLFAAVGLQPGGAALAQEMTPTPLPVCTDPSRPGVGCDCTTGVEDACGPTTLLCCATEPNAAPGSPGVCTPSSVGCNPRGPLPASCTGHGCRCDAGTENACDDPLVCCPDDPGLPGGPGKCVRQERCNPQSCTGEGCACDSGDPNACDNDLFCCADDSSLPGSPGRCEDEQACLSQQCQATTNPCPSSCPAGNYCQWCCSGYCGDDDHCAPAPCTGVGCECTAGTADACAAGLVCCQDQTGGPTGPGGAGKCATQEDCNGPTPCLDVGCSCTAGVEGSCGPGLVCCQSQMTAPNYPGGPGMCATHDGCGGTAGPVGSAQATPVG
jgi:hypothetical protein